MGRPVNQFCISSFQDIHVAVRIGQAFNTEVSFHWGGRVGSPHIILIPVNDL